MKLLICFQDAKMRREVVYLPILTGSDTARAQACFTVHTRVTATQNRKFKSIWYPVFFDYYNMLNYCYPETMEWRATWKTRDFGNYKSLPLDPGSGRKNQFRTLPMKGSSYKYHNYERFSIQTHLFAVLSASVTLINWLSEEAIAVTIDREAAANVRNGIFSSTYR